jgi:hypothetical protein
MIKKLKGYEYLFDYKEEYYLLDMTEYVYDNMSSVLGKDSLN